MITALVTLLVNQLVGEAVVRLTSLPNPGPVVGMVWLLVVMLARMPPPPALGDTTDGSLRHLSLLFVPAATYMRPNLVRGTERPSNNVTYARKPRISANSPTD